MTSSDILLVDRLDAFGASPADTRARLEALAAAGLPARAVVVDPQSTHAVVRLGATTVPDLPAAFAWAVRQSTKSAFPRLVLAAARPDGAQARLLPRGVEAWWWPTALGVSATAGQDRGWAVLGECGDGDAALERAIAAPDPGGRARVTLWTGDYVLVPVAPDLREMHQVLEGFARVPARRSLDLVLLADPDPTVLAAARALGLGQRVHHIGRPPRGSVSAWLAGAAAVLVTGGAPLAATAVLRAMSAGVPLVAFGDSATSRSLDGWLAARGARVVPRATVGAALGESLEAALAGGAAVEDLLLAGLEAAAAGEPAAAAGWLRAALPGAAAGESAA